MLTVPPAVVRSTTTALRLQNDRPLPNIYGEDTAKLLATGSVTEETADRCRRFLTVNREEYREAVRELQTEDESPIVRNWLLHGGEAAQAWLGEAAASDLTSLTPPDLTVRLANGAWRHEYGFTPASIARLLENYGGTIPLETFGRAANAVKLAVCRRQPSIEDLAHHMHQRQCVRDPIYRAAAEVDLHAMEQSTALLETFTPQLYGTSAGNTFIKSAFPVILSYFLLAVEDKAAIHAIQHGKQVPAAADQPLGPYTKYNDAINFIQALFHPKGKRYVNPATLNAKFAGLDQQMLLYAFKAYKGYYIPKNVIQNLLGKFRLYLSARKMIFTPAASLQNDWQKGDWAGIAKWVPPAADTLPGMKALEAASKAPDGGAELQQTPDTPPMHGVAIPLADTLFGKACAAKGTPVGVHSVIKIGETTAEVEGAHGDTGNVTIVTSTYGSPFYTPDSSAAQNIQSGAWKVIQAHADLPGTAYGPAAEPVSPQEPGVVSTQVAAVLKGMDAEDAKIVPLSGTIFGQACAAKGTPVGVHSTVVVDKFAYAVVGAYDTSTDGTVIVFADPVDGSHWASADAVAALNIQDGVWKVVGTGAASSLLPVNLPVKQPASDVTSTASYKAAAQQYAYYLQPGSKLESEAGKFTLTGYGYGDGNAVVFNLKDGDGNAHQLDDADLAQSLADGDVWPEGHKPMEDVFDSADEYFQEAFADSITQWEPYHILSSASAEAFADKYGIDLKLGQSFLDKEGKPFRLEAIYYNKYSGKVLIVYRTADNQFNEVSDTALAGAIVKETAKATGKQSVQHFPAMPAPMVTPVVPEPEPAASPAPTPTVSPKPKPPTASPAATTPVAVAPFVFGDVLKSGPVLYYVLAADSQWVVVVRAQGDSEPQLFFISVPGMQFAGLVWQKVNHLADPYDLKNYQFGLGLAAGMTPAGWPDVGDPVFWQGKDYKFYAVVKAADGDLHPILAAWQSKSFVQFPNQNFLWYSFKVAPSDLFANTATSSYAPGPSAPPPEVKIPETYAHANAFVPSTGEVTFGKNKTDPAMLVSYSDVYLPSTFQGDYPVADKIKQPAFADLGTGHVSAGVVAVFPPATAISANTNEPGASPDKVLAVMVHPLNNFGGYSLTFPKGTVDKGEAIETAAVREFFEETGLAVKIVAYLGDFKGDTSVTRMFMGYVVGGDPKKAGWETDAVTLKPLGDKKAAWRKELKDRDAQILMAAEGWVKNHPYPHLYIPETADSYSQVTAEADTSGTPAPQTMTLPAKGKMLAVANLDYAVNSATVGEIDAMTAAKAWSFLPQKSFTDKGYPKVGEAFKTPQGETSMAVAYVFQKTENFAVSRLMARSASGILTAFTLVTKNAGGVKQTLLQPSDFTSTPAVGTFTPSLPAVPSAIDQIWNNFVLTSPFPVSKGMLTVLKEQTSNAKPIQSVTGVLDGFCKIGDTFTLFSQTKFGCLGYAVIQFTNGTTEKYVIMEFNAVSDTTLAGATVKESLPDGGVYAAAVSTVANNVSLMDHAYYADAFFKDPDPLWSAGGAGMTALKSVASGQSAASMFNLKQWKAILSSAKVPNTSGLTMAMVPQVLKLLIPNACSTWQRDHILAGLAHNAELQGSGATGTLTFAGVTVPAGPNITAWPDQPVTPTAPAKPAAPAGPPPKIIIPMGEYYSAQWKAQLLDAQGKDFKKISGKTPQGGTHVTFLLEGPGGATWFGKQAHDGTGTRVAAEAAAYKLIAPYVFEAVPQATITLDGVLTGIQPYLTDLDPASAFKQDPNEEGDANKAVLLRDHVWDMFFCDHDGNRQNYLKRNGKLVRIDRGQAFKGYLIGEGPILNPAYQPTANYGAGYAKDLLMAWSKGKADIPPAAFETMREAIADVQTLSDSDITSALQPYFEAAKADDTARATVLLKVLKARDNCLSDWTAVLKKLRKDFKWPAFDALPKNVFHADPKQAGFTAQHAQTIAEAVAAGGQGKTIAIDGPNIENQEVMIHAVKWQVSATSLVDATMINFRMTDYGGKQAVANMLKSPYTDVVQSHAGVDDGKPKPLKVDVKYNFWPVIFKAARTVNRHYFSGPGGNKKIDGKPNMTVLGQAIALKPKLLELYNATSSPFGQYPETNEPNAIVNAMAKQYLDYIGLLEYYYTADAATSASLMGKHTPILGQYVYEPPPAKKTGETKPFTIHAVQQGAMLPSFPQTWMSDNKPGGYLTGGEIRVSGLNNPTHNSPSQSQLVIDDPNANAHLFLNPPAGVSGVLPGVRGAMAIGWGIMPGALSSKTVSHLVGLLAKAGGIELAPAKPADREAVYWIKQGAVLQNGGVSTPDNNHEIALSTGLAQAMAQYRQGNADAAVTKAKAFVAGQLGVTAAALTKQPGYDPALMTHDSMGAGWARPLRINWTRDKLVSFFGANVHFGHGVGQNILNFFQRIAGRGVWALVANNVKTFYAVPPGGSSATEDFSRGGSQGIFMCLRSNWYADQLYFDISLALRTDVYLVGTGDTFGDTGVTRYLTPESWKSQGAVGTGECSSKSAYQISARHDVDLRQYLHTVPCSDGAVVLAIRKLCKDAGITTFAQGRTLEQVIVKKGQEVP